MANPIIWINAALLSLLSVKRKIAPAFACHYLYLLYHKSADFSHSKTRRKTENSRQNRGHRVALPARKRGITFCAAETRHRIEIAYARKSFPSAHKTRIKPVSLQMRSANGAAWRGGKWRFLSGLWRILSVNSARFLMAFLSALCVLCGKAFAAAFDALALSPSRC